MAQVREIGFSTTLLLPAMIMYLHCAHPYDYNVIKQAWKAGMPYFQGLRYV